MRGAVLVAIAASIGNMLQGWDNATIAGSLLYIKKEFNLQSEPTIEGLIVAMSLIGATVITTFSGPLSDSVGRRPMLIGSSLLYFLSGLVMSWSPNVYSLLLARLLDGFGVGLAVTLVPVYISETAPPEIRGLLNTLPQFLGCAGMFVSYCMVFGMSLTDAPSWRLMLGVLSIPSLAYTALTVMFLPESPRWLVTKGRMEEAKLVLQQLSGKEDVSGEMALLVEGLGVGGDTSIEEYIISPINELSSDSHEHVQDKEQIKLYGSNEVGVSWIAKPVSGDTPVSRYGSLTTQSMSFVDATVNLFGSIHEKFHPDTGSRRSIFFPNFGSAFNVADHHGKPEDWDEDRDQGGEDHESSSSSSGSESGENLRSPLLSRQDINAEKDLESNGGGLNARLHSSLMQANAGEAVDGMDIGGGWQLAYKYSEEVKGEDGKKGGGLQRIYLHQEGTPGSRRGSVVQVSGDNVHPEGESVHAAALISRSMLQTDLTGHVPLEGDIVLPSKTAAKGPTWVDLFEPGVKHALVVGVGLQILQQFSGINGVLYYTPQILEQAGVGVLLSDMGIRPDSASLLISAVTSLLMLPTIGVAMRLMDRAGRRWLLLSTLPVLLLSLVFLVLGSMIPLSEVVHAVIATVSVVVYFCTFVMGFGPIPNILCSEIFPTRVRGYCIAICALTFWICDIIVTYSLPVMLNSVGLGGVFAIYAVVCAVAWVFVFIRVPETKGMPLEVITEFFAVGAKQAADAAKNK